MKNLFYVITLLFSVNAHSTDGQFSLQALLCTGSNLEQPEETNTPKAEQPKTLINRAHDKPLINKTLINKAHGKPSFKTYTLSPHWSSLALWRKNTHKKLMHLRADINAICALCSSLAFWCCQNTHKKLMHLRADINAIYVLLKAARERERKLQQAEELDTNETRKRWPFVRYSTCVHRTSNVVYAFWRSLKP